MKRREQSPTSFSCPLPIQEHPQILLAHGGGGRLTHRLIREMFLPAMSNPLLEQRHDGAVFDFGGTRVAFTTDSFVVQPLFFPGGDIGALAIHGTVNDLAMCGARPLYLSAGLILEEGLPVETLWEVVCSMQTAARVSGIEVVTGDTKVVDRGKGDGIFINTSGIGVVESALPISPASIQPGDKLLVNGDIGRHGIAVMSAREHLAFETEIESDLADLSGLVLKLLEAGITIHCLRDLTRGGLASAVIEIAETAHVNIRFEETSIPVREDVHGACEVLGIDPLYSANEGRFVAMIPEQDVEPALQIMRSDSIGQEACVVGEVVGPGEGMVTITSPIGVNRIVDMLSGEQLPRIC